MTPLKHLKYLTAVSLFLLATLATTSTNAVSSPQIRITEIMYDPPGSAIREFIEIYNGSDTGADLSGWSMFGVDFNFPNGTILAPGEYAVIANDQSILQAQHPSLEVLGEYSGDLEGTGETIKVLNQLNEVVSEVAYGSSSPWPSSPYDGGPTLSLIRLNADESLVECWSESTSNGGTPGALNSVADANQTGCLDKAYAQTIVVNPPDTDPSPVSPSPQTLTPPIQTLKKALPQPTPPPTTQDLLTEQAEPVQTPEPLQESLTITPESPVTLNAVEQSKISFKTKLAIASTTVGTISVLILLQQMPTLASRARHKKLLKFKDGFKEL